MKLGRVLQTIVVIGLLGLCCLLTSPTWMGASQHTRFSRADHAGIAAACSTLMAAHPPKSPPRELRQGEAGYDALPPAVRALEPTCVQISNDAVTIESWGAALEARRAPGPPTRGPGAREVHPGLWLTAPD